MERNSTINRRAPYHGSLCEIDDCFRRAKSRLMCGTHYERWRKHGDTNVILAGGAPRQNIEIIHTSNGCHEWQGAATRGGYARRTINNKGVQLSRLILEQKLGHKLAPGMKALHTCDNPHCINPEHLWEGTQRDNMQDCSRKGRFPIRSGSRANSSKLKEDIVLHIRELLSTGWLLREIAKEFSISISNVSMIKRRETWVHI